MTPQSFMDKWGPGGSAYALNERQGAQMHFIDLCAVLGVPAPTGVNDGQDDYLFEIGTQALGQQRGFADVFKRGCFAWEYKAPGKPLDAALKQLMTYALALDSPPLLIVSDRLRIEIHTHFTGTPSECHVVELRELGDPAKRELLRRCFTAPNSFKPARTNRQITEEAASAFASTAERLRDAGVSAEQVSHFLTQCLFCFFAEDVGLLPDKLFERLVGARTEPEALRRGMQSLFTTMRDGGLFGVDDIPWFNGGLFQRVDVPALTAMDVSALRSAAALDWSAIDPSIFGTLFERGLDPAKRSQLGAHYTDPATIMRLIEPVVQRPLLAEWAEVKQRIGAQLAKSKKSTDKAARDANAEFIGFLEKLREFKVLDPACGSGNFLYLALKALKDIEHQANIEAEALGLQRQVDAYTSPANVLGIELNEYAAELARVTIWIGELQWRLQHGYPFKVNPILDPLDQIEHRDALLVFDAEITHAKWFDKHTPAYIGAAKLGKGGYGATRKGTTLDESQGSAWTEIQVQERYLVDERWVAEAPWPTASVVIGNPPFVGDKKMRRELGAGYTNALRSVFKGRVPGGADLVTYWFEKARAQIEHAGLGAAGLVATNAIRGGKNREVLDAICKTTRIFEAWSDEPWVNYGAAVRVSLVAFGFSDQRACLNGQPADQIHADLSGSSSARVGMRVGQRLKEFINPFVDLTLASALQENAGACFMGITKVGPFDIDGRDARSWLRLPNPHAESNASVLRPSWNGLDVTRRIRDVWIVDFGVERSESASALFEAPYEYALRIIKPFRATNNREAYRVTWWRHGEARPGLRRLLQPLSRYIVTPEVAKHRVFVWAPALVLPDKNLQVTPRADDTTFGTLHSRFHELWSLRMCTWMGKGNDPRYTPTTCFDTFPFPAGLAPRDTAHQRTEALDNGALIPADLPPAARPHAEAVARAAKRLNDLREAWLNPPEWTRREPEVVPLGMSESPYPDRIVPREGFETELAQRTLTKLYNERPAWLAQAHEALDAAVAAAYGWADYTPQMPDDEILRRLLALNRERAGG